VTRVALLILLLMVGVANADPARCLIYRDGDRLRAVMPADNPIALTTDHLPRVYPWEGANSSATVRRYGDSLHAEFKLDIAGPDWFWVVVNSQRGGMSVRWMRSNGAADGEWHERDFSGPDQLFASEVGPVVCEQFARLGQPAALPDMTVLRSWRDIDPPADLALDATAVALIHALDSDDWCERSAAQAMLTSPLLACRLPRLARLIHLTPAQRCGIDAALSAYDCEIDPALVGPLREAAR
jgi:hypothetical protein